MYYLLLLLEIVLTVLALRYRHRKWQVRRLQINPKGHDEHSHNMIKSGKTKHLQRARQKYRNDMMLWLALGLAVITFTLFYSANELLQQHREDGLLDGIL